jgi:ketosteroid isomerase-like protein
MKLAGTIGAALVLAACSQASQQSSQSKEAAVGQRPSDAESEAYMRKAEEDWATLAWKNDPAVLERILADDYVGVASENVVRNKKQAVAAAAEPVTGTYVSSHLDYVNYRHFGDTVLAQGQESVQRKDGGPDLRLIWTDVWMWRNGKWQIVASQDNVVPPEKK